MTWVILQYKQVIQFEFETGANAAFEPYVRESNIFTHQPSVPPAFGPSVTFNDGIVNFATPQTTSAFGPAIESTSELQGGHEYVNAWWTNSFGEGSCEGSPGQIVLIRPIPDWYTPTQDTNRRLFLGIDDPC